jgi:hypothetical protein
MIDKPRFELRQIQPPTPGIAIADDRLETAPNSKIMKGPPQVGDAIKNGFEFRTGYFISSEYAGPRDWRPRLIRS